MTAPLNPGLLANGPWGPAQVECAWLDDVYAPAQKLLDAADVVLDGLRERGSPSHDGLAGRLADFTLTDSGLELQLQPARWSLRLIEEDSSQCIAGLCVTRAADGRWLAGRRAAWLASWPGRWALGAGGSVEVGEHPAETLVRELEEEWSVRPEKLTSEALLLLPTRLAMFVGMAWLPDGAEVTPDDEHDAYEWWPAEIDQWPGYADEPLRRMAKFLTR